MIALLLACAQVDFADQVLDAPGADLGVRYGDPHRAANGARGAGCCAGSVDVYSLTLDGERPELVLGFSGRVVTDGPGDDLVVFENPFEVGDEVFVDPVIVGVSADGEAFEDFPHLYTAPDPEAYDADPRHWEGFAGVTPTVHHIDEEPPRAAFRAGAGGDRFDLAELPDGPVRDAVLTRGALAVRLRPAATAIDPRTGAPFPAHAISDGPDIDAVYARFLAPR